MTNRVVFIPDKERNRDRRLSFETFPPQFWTEKFEVANVTFSNREDAKNICFRSNFWPLELPRFDDSRQILRNGVSMENWLIGNKKHGESSPKSDQTFLQEAGKKAGEEAFVLRDSRERERQRWSGEIWR